MILRQIAILILGLASATASTAASDFLRAGDEAFRAGKVKDAIKAYGKLIASDRTQASSYWKRASVYMVKRNYKQAARDLDMCVELDPGMLKAWTARGRANLHLGKCYEAVSDLQHTLQNKPGDKSATKEYPRAEKCRNLLQIVQRDIENHHLDHALQITNELRTLASASVSVLLTRCDIHALKSDWQSLGVDTREILIMDSKNLQALQLRAQSFYYMMEHDNALTHYKQGLKMDPEHKKLKAGFKSLKKMEKAIKNAENLQQRGRKAEAVKAWTGVVAMDANHRVLKIRGYVQICDLNLQTKKAEDAVQTCRQLTQMDPQNFDAHMHLGEAHLLLDQFDEATKAFNQAAELQPNNRSPREAKERTETLKKRANRKDYYQLLGIPKTASEKDIKKAFRKLALKWHPDRAKADEKEEHEKKFRDIAEAHDVLSNQDLRARYDRGEDVNGSPSDNQQHGHGHGHPFGFGGFGGGFRRGPF